ncbi:hypothetical protein DSO57_1004626 [Entomophthora muscae]|uniref:Uncharacterized protein n=1 Tax=Entomophthora muscae TaxID=34485 RepID=A0ACC2SKS2_9FUNG|nr:hypothetical protein DSO57_1004626 [Entomophthora muscae]
MLPTRPLPVPKPLSFTNFQHRVFIKAESALACTTASMWTVMSGDYFASIEIQTIAPNWACGHSKELIPLLDICCLHSTWAWLRYHPVWIRGPLSGISTTALQIKLYRILTLCPPYWAASSPDLNTEL